jgi:glycosyltransferase involved in cell wall biosynthesis
MPIDVFGPIDQGETRSLTQEFYSRDSATGVSYKGVLTGPELAEIRREYAYSIVMWAPINDNQRYAAPNKFFEAIADGVPPIAAPHPQCETIIRRYNCGVLMRDWSFDAFKTALEKALALFGTDAYADMVENCRRAFEAELNWNHAFAAIERHLDAT